MASAMSPGPGMQAHPLLQPHNLSRRHTPPTAALSTEGQPEPVLPLRFGIDADLQAALPKELSEPVRRVLSLANAGNSETTKARVRQAITAFQERPGDTGSTSVQVAILTVRIAAAKTHLASHRKDNPSKRALDKLMNRRRKLLQYLKRTDFDQYRRVVYAMKLV